MKKNIQFGEKVEGYTIPVLNEREIRASAGILFFFVIVAIMMAGMDMNFILIKYFVIGFLLEFIIRVFINPKFAPTLILGRFIVRNQVPEYVGAEQKKFAWVIGFILALTMFVLMVIMNTYSPITGLICLLCIIFLFFESAFGICLGCISYKWIKGKNAQYCPGEVCEVKDRHEIQKTSFVQWLIVLAFIGFIALSVIFFHDFIKETPIDLFGINS